jgi:hypothetical protein
VPWFERSLKRALKGLVDRGDVLVLGGKGGPGDPRHYVTVETFASKAESKKVTDTSYAKQLVAEMAEAVAKVMAGGGIAAMVKRKRKRKEVQQEADSVSVVVCLPNGTNPVKCPCLFRDFRSLSDRGHFAWDAHRSISATQNGPRKFEEKFGRSAFRFGEFGAVSFRLALEAQISDA